jgi:hypothetical protein
MGIYAYRPEFLTALTRLPPSRLEQLEKLEQLRALESGASILVVQAKHAARAVLQAHGLLGPSMPPPLRPQPYAEAHAARDAHGSGRIAGNSDVDTGLRTSGTRAPERRRAPPSVHRGCGWPSASAPRTSERGCHDQQLLCDPQQQVILEKMEFPDPVIEIAVEPKSKADQEKLGVALMKLAAEDPSFRVSTDPESGQTILKGMGELHLDIKIDILKRA